MASHQQRAYRTYGAVQGVDETFMPTLLPDGWHYGSQNGCKSPIWYTDEWLDSLVEKLMETVSDRSRSSMSTNVNLLPWIKTFKETSYFQLSAKTKSKRRFRLLLLTVNFSCKRVICCYCTRHFKALYALSQTSHDWQVWLIFFSAIFKFVCLWTLYTSLKGVYHANGRLLSLA